VRIAVSGCHERLVDACPDSNSGTEAQTNGQALADTGEEVLSLR
jgi:hypothetical protein